MATREAMDLVRQYAAWKRGEAEEPDLRRADLREAYLICADLGCADLRLADLREACLIEADLGCADLRGAYLIEADLRLADLREANLEGTCLSGATGCTPAALAYHGWEVLDGLVYGWRTEFSKHVGLNHYQPGQTYEAPVFSMSRETSCHPGIYMLMTKEQALLESSNIVRVRARCEDVCLLDAWRTKGIRAKRIEVLYCDEQGGIE